MDSERIGVLLFNLGGPESLEQVRPFLYNIFSDPDIIRLPWRALQKPLAWLISTQRHKKSSGYYEKIGGGSPLRKITDQQARALETLLESDGISARIYVGMRYWEPFIENALERIRQDGIKRLVVLPLYPQYSISTTGSSLNRMNALLDADARSELTISVIENWHDDPGYIGALSATISSELAKFPAVDPTRTRIVFSAHSVPVSYIEQGDPYLDQIRETVRLVMDRLGDHLPHCLSFQSKVGPAKWLGPSTDQTIRSLARDGVSQLLLVPVSFVSEHIETLYELDFLYRGVADEAGITHYRRSAALNCSPDFIASLARLVRKSLNER
jgi:ferrochelatase